ncbi:androgen-dependent TFPI-regulating protein-like [Polypterus senegalus]|uniref:androgen-dependent TFPI-regulating protein-like n=1 Tax=Polypterus senegalus TaxID=55291 RepID=UPI001962986B|nr:androgen-dependent TFPI-regulating protein-like [Polypterus senegalus]
MGAKMGSMAYHFLLFAWYTFLVVLMLLIDTDKVPMGIFAYAGLWKYLTFLNLVLQMLYFGISLILDIYTSLQKHPKAGMLTSSKDILFSVLAFPVGSFVVTIFWMIFLYDRELVYTKEMDRIIPSWLNHSLHTIVLPFLLIEIFLQPHVYPERKHGMALLGLCSAGYLSWVVWIYITVGAWVYPLLGKLSPLALAVFFVVSTGLAFSLYVLGEVLNAYTWGETPKKAKTK